VTQVVAALIRRGDAVLLVRQQGPDDPEPAWALPGGIVEERELLTEALAREVWEETGLRIEEVGWLIYVAQLHNPSDHSRSAGELPPPSGEATAFVFEASVLGHQPSGADPGAFVSDARFLALQEAIERLEALPWRFMREPIVAYLRGEAGVGAVWLYRRNQDGSDELVTDTPGMRTRPIRRPRARSRRTAAIQTDSAPRRLAFSDQLLIVGCLGLLAGLALVIVIGIIASSH
jgi:ADP-ribose pyrophosphatase YjhB (NUDIX family)